MSNRPTPSGGDPPRVALGRVVMTREAQQRLATEEVVAALRRHARGDWGEVCAADRRENELSLRQGRRLLSAYRTASGEAFWIITEADRTSTCVLLPADY